MTHIEQVAYQAARENNIIGDAPPKPRRERDDDVDPDAPPKMTIEEGRRLRQEEIERRSALDPNYQPPADGEQAAEPTEPTAGFDVEDLEDVDDPQHAGTTEPPSGIPSWVKVPPNLVFPDGWQVWFIQFRAEMTNVRRNGDRQAILWALSETDEKRAARRANGIAVRLVDECAKAMIRVIDGRVANWMKKTGPDSVELFWDEIGGKCRHQLKNIYLQSHTMDAKENARFFDECVAVRTVG